MKKPAIYILTNTHHTTIYIGVTSNLKRRIYQHKNKLIAGFSSRYNLEKLIYFEQFTFIEDAIVREKRLKNWKRAWKNRLISEFNPTWDDLYLSLF